MIANKKMMTFLLILNVLLSIGTTFGSNKCTVLNANSIDVPVRGITCVANEQVNDVYHRVGRSPRGVVQVFTSTKSGKRLEKTEKRFNESAVLSGTQWTIKIDGNKTYQEIIGFGTALSDAAVLDIGKMSPKLQRQILSDFFSEKGIELSMARTTIAGSDFSIRKYTYDDTDNNTNDWDLKHFHLADEDIKYRIPQMKIINQVARHKPKYFGSPWSGPAWLKTNHQIIGNGTLIGKAGSKEWETYSNYLIRWLKSYRSQGIEFWGMTVQNEPTTGLQKNFPWNTMGFTPEMERDFVKTDLGPALERNGWGPNKFNLMILDHNRDMIPEWTDVILGDAGAAKYANGVATHWYGNGVAGPEKYDQLHKKFPNHFILATEACNGWQDKESRISLGNWSFGESYARDILRDLSHWVSGWNDWNAVLDMDGKPNWVGPDHYESASIIVNPFKNEYYKNPMFYAFAHFSKFLPPGSKRIGQTPEVVDEKGILSAAFVRPDGGYVYIVINYWDIQNGFVITDPKLGQLNMPIEPHSFNTWVYYA